MAAAELLPVYAHQPKNNTKNFSTYIQYHRECARRD
jgi:hypothetical protein